MIGLVLVGLLQSAPATDTVDRAKLEEIYQRPGFERARRRNDGALQQLWKNFVAWFNKAFGSRGAETYSVVARFVVLLVAALVALWAVLKMLGRKRAAVAPAASAGPAPLVLDDPTTHLGRGRALLATDSRAALREGLLALLSTLERQKLARPDRVKTNRELAGELPGRGAPASLTSRVEQLVAWYDRTFYSLEPVGTQDAARFLDDIERLA